MLRSHGLTQMAWPLPVPGIQRFRRFRLNASRSSGLVKCRTGRLARAFPRTARSTTCHDEPRRGGASSSSWTTPRLVILSRPFFSSLLAQDRRDRVRLRARTPRAARVGTGGASRWPGRSRRGAPARPALRGRGAPEASRVRRRRRASAARTAPAGRLAAISRAQRATRAALPPLSARPNRCPGHARPRFSPKGSGRFRP